MSTTPKDLSNMQAQIDDTGTSSIVNDDDLGDFRFDEALLDDSEYMAIAESEYYKE